MEISQRLTAKKEFLLFDSSERLDSTPRCSCLFELLHSEDDGSVRWRCSWQQRSKRAASVVGPPRECGTGKKMREKENSSGLVVVVVIPEPRTNDAM